MQPARLHKFQSVDCGPAAASMASEQQQQRRQQKQRLTQPAQTQQQQTQSQSQPSLVHSISIVVELAKEAQQHGGGGGFQLQSGGGSFSSHCSNEDEETTATTTSDEQPLVAQGSLDEDVELAPQVLVQAAGGGGGGGGGRKAEVQRDNSDDEENNDENENEDEEDDDDDDAEDEQSCLASSLARRVVLVDEADKKFMRNRAQSAEPRMLRGIFASLRREPARAELGSSTESADCNQLPVAGQRAPSPPVRPLGPRLSLAAQLAGGRGELAESGRLSMRRNTHHHHPHRAPPQQPQQQQQQPHSAQLVELRRPGNEGALALGALGATRPLDYQRAPGASAIDANSAVASSELPSPQRQQRPQRASPLASSSTSSSSNFNATTSSCRPSSPSINRKQQQQQQHLQQHLRLVTAAHDLLPPVHHRRQSLQIGLLAGGLGARCTESSRSLTEEELRGEREFNEQVRNAARPLGAPNSLKAAGGTTSATSRRAITGARSVGFASREPPRCRSTGHEEPHSYQQLEEQLKQKQQQQQQHLIYSHHNLLPLAHTGGGGGAPGPRDQRRRVSFGCIEPVELRLAQQASEPHAAAQRDRLNEGDISQQQQQQQQPASPLSLRQHKHRASICGPVISSAGILRKLDRLEAGQPRPAASDIDPRRTGPGMADERAAQRAVCAPDAPDATPTSAPPPPSLARQQYDSNTVTRTIINQGQPARARPGSEGEQIGDDYERHAQLDGPGEGSAAGGQGQPPAGRKRQSKSISVVAAERDASRVHSIMANAKLRQEEFARLLEEHEQIVNEINRFETKISTSNQSQQQQRQTEQPQHQEQDATRQGQGGGGG